MKSRNEIILDLLIESKIDKEEALILLGTDLGEKVVRVTHVTPEDPNPFIRHDSPYNRPTSGTPPFDWHYQESNIAQ